MARSRRFAMMGVLGLALALPACGDAEEPGEQAVEGIEQTRQAVDELQERVETLRSQAERLEQRLTDHAAKLLALIELRLESAQATAARLPAEEEQVLRQQLAALEQQRQQVGQTLESYIAAEGAEADRLRGELEEQIDQLDQAVADFNDRLGAARAGG